MQEDLQSVFSVAEFVRDFENVWEWLEGYSEDFNCAVNISREHNFLTGQYDKPIMVTIKALPYSGQYREELLSIAILLNEAFSVPTYVGTIFPYGHIYQFEILKSIS